MPDTRSEQIEALGFCADHCPAASENRRAECRSIPCYDLSAALEAKPAAEVTDEARGGNMPYVASCCDQSQPPVTDETDIERVRLLDERTKSSMVDAEVTDEAVALVRFSIRGNCVGCVEEHVCSKMDGELLCGEALATIEARLSEIERLRGQSLADAIRANSYERELVKAQSEIERLQDEYENSLDIQERQRDEIERLRSDHAPHYCSDKHEPIRHWDSENEMCPLCRANAEIERLREDVGTFSALEAKTAAEVMDCCDETKCDWLEAHGDPKVQLMGRLLRQRLSELTAPARHSL